jgi:ADP-ribose pyrophosphatase
MGDPLFSQDLDSWSMTAPADRPPEVQAEIERRFPREDAHFAWKLMEDVGKLVRTGIASGYDTVWKPDNTPVTDVDIKVNQFIIDAVHASYPTDRILGEEASLDGESGFTWIVDPIDGTQALGIVPTSTTCIARTDQEGQPLFGIAYNAQTDELFEAEKGKRTTLNGEEVKVSEKSDIKGSYIFLGSRMPDTVATNGVVYDRIEEQGGKIFNARSLATGCLLVAAGKVEGAFIGVKSPYEAATVKLIVENAGGRVTDLYGNEPGRLDGEIRGLVVSNGLIHEALLAALKPSEANATEGATKIKAETNPVSSELVDHVAQSIKSRTEKPAIYPERFPVPDDKASWDTGYSYAPDYFVADVVLAQDSSVKPGGWADPEDIDKLERKLHSYEGKVQFDDQGHPRNPYTRTGLKGRGLLGKWGANFAADPIISRINPNSGAFEIVVIERSDTHEWAIPGGMVDEGEDVSQTVEREFMEEAGASLNMSGAELVYQGYVDDPRNTDNAWMETTAKHLHLDGELASQLSLQAGDDAKAVRWLDVNPEALENLYASHGPMIRKAIGLFLARPDIEISDETRAKLGNALHIA